MLRIGEQHLAVLNLQHARRVVVSLNPRLQEGFDTVELLEALKVETVVVVVLLGARNELFQGLAAILRQGVVLEIPNLFTLECATRQPHQAADYQSPARHGYLVLRVKLRSIRPKQPLAGHAAQRPPRPPGWLVCLGNRTP